MDVRSTLLELVPLLYGAEVSENGWIVFLEQLELLSGADAGALVLLDQAGAPKELLACGKLMIPIMRDYERHFAAIDPWPAAFAASGRQLGQHVCSHELLDPREFEQTEYYHDFWRVHDDIFYTCGALIPVDNTTIANFAIPRSRKRGPYTKDHVRLMDSLTPHVTGVLRLRKEIALGRERLLNLEAVLERNSDALVVIDGKRRLLHANSHGARDLKQGRHLRLAQGRVVSGTSIDAAAFDKSLRAALGLDSASATGRPGSLRSMPGAGALAHLSFFPLAKPISLAIGADSARVLIVIREKEGQELNIASSLRVLFGLTPTEAVIAEKLASGSTLKNVADDMCVGIGTVRIHLKHIFGKTDTRRQSELVSLIYRLIPITYQQE